jgi:hypothetical protein
MLGIDGKEKPVYVEGDKLYFELDGKKYPVVVRGKVSENVVDFWIVEFEDGPPDGVVYPYSCAPALHTQLSRRVEGSKGALAKALDALAGADNIIWAHFGLESQCYNILDYRACFWAQEGTRTIGWWDGESQLQDAKNAAESDDPEDWEAMYSGEIRGTSVWVTADYTMAVLHDGCGNQDAYIFANKNKVR